MFNERILGELKKAMCPHGLQMLELIDQIDNETVKDSTLRFLLEHAVSHHEYIHLQESVLETVMKAVMVREMNVTTGRLTDETILFYTRKVKECEARVLVEHQQLFDDFMDGARKRLEILKKR